MVEVAEEFIEAVDCREILVPVAKVILPELAGGVAEWLEQFGNGRVFLLQAHTGGRQSDPAQSGAKDALAGDERRPTGCAALLRIIIGEEHAFLRYAINIRRAVAHQPPCVSAYVCLPDVVAHDDENVGPLLLFWRIGCVCRYDRCSRHGGCDKDTDNGRPQADPAVS